MYFCALSEQGEGEEWRETEDLAATSDSGLGSHGAPSVIGEEGICGQFFFLGIDSKQHTYTYKQPLYV